MSNNFSEHQFFTCQVGLTPISKVVKNWIVCVRFLAYRKLLKKKFLMLLFIFYLIRSLRSSCKPVRQLKKKKKIQEWRRISDALRWPEMICNVPSSSKHWLFQDSCVRSVVGHCMMNWQLGSADSECHQVMEGAVALGWNALRGLVKKFWAVWDTTNAQFN